MDGLRELSVLTDGNKVVTGHIRLQGKSTMSLRPDLWLLDFFEIDSVSTAQIENAKEIRVIGEANSELCRGEVEEIHSFYENGKHITRVVISDGMSFWGSIVSVSIAGGNTIEWALKTVVNRCSSPIKISSYQAEKRVLSRGQVFHGSTVRYVSELARSVCARAFINHGVLSVYSRGKSASLVKLSEERGLISTGRTDGAVIARMGYMLGFTVGQLVTIPDDVKKYRLLCQSIDADNKDGMWRTELLMVDENGMTDEEWSRGI